MMLQHCLVKSAEKQTFIQQLKAMSKDMDERFDAQYTKDNSWKSEMVITSVMIKAFLRTELADQKARAIEIIKEWPRNPEMDDELIAIATALEEKL